MKEAFLYLPRHNFGLSFYRRKPNRPPFTLDFSDSIYDELKGTPFTQHPQAGSMTLPAKLKTLSPEETPLFLKDVIHNLAEQMLYLSSFSITHNALTPDHIILTPKLQTQNPSVIISYWAQSSKTSYEEALFYNFSSLIFLLSTLFPTEDHDLELLSPLPFPAFIQAMIQGDLVLKNKLLTHTLPSIPQLHDFFCDALDFIYKQSFYDFPDLVHSPSFTADRPCILPFTFSKPSGSPCEHLLQLHPQLSFTYSLKAPPLSSKSAYLFYMNDDSFMTIIYKMKKTPLSLFHFHENKMVFSYAHTKIHLYYEDAYIPSYLNNTITLSPHHLLLLKKDGLKKRIKAVVIQEKSPSSRCFHSSKTRIVKDEHYSLFQLTLKRKPHLPVKAPPIPTEKLSNLLSELSCYPQNSIVSGESIAIIIGDTFYKILFFPPSQDMIDVYQRLKGSSFTSGHIYALPDYTCLEVHLKKSNPFHCLFIEEQPAIQGIELDQYMKDFGSPLDSFVEFILPLLPSVMMDLITLSQKGVAHGDLKYSNILISTSPDFTPQHHLIDWGFSQALPQRQAFLHNMATLIQFISSLAYNPVFLEIYDNPLHHRQRFFRRDPLTLRPQRGMNTTTDGLYQFLLSPEDNNETLQFLQMHIEDQKSPPLASLYQNIITAIRKRNISALKQERHKLLKFLVTHPSPSFLDSPFYKSVLTQYQNLSSQTPFTPSPSYHIQPTLLSA